MENLGSVLLSIWRKEDARVTCIDKHPYISELQQPKLAENTLNDQKDPSPDSAGYDLNKIIRTEYDEPLYAEMGQL